MIERLQSRLKDQIFQKPNLDKTVLVKLIFDLRQCLRNAREFTKNGGAICMKQKK
jgi:hypothetical protein